MDFNEYQTLSKRTALYPRQGNNITYTTLGLVGEAGEIANKVKKIERDHGGILDDEQKKAIAKELGDVLWYVAQMATELSTTLDKVADDNLAWLMARKERGTLHGSGDDR